MNQLAIRTDHINFSYGKQQIVRDLCLEVPENAIYGFLGTNGAGKTTTIKLLLGLLRAGHTGVYYFGQDLYEHRYKILAQVGSLVETPSLYGHLTAWDNITYLDILFQKGKHRIEEVLDLVGLTEVAHKKVKHFSLGMKQRLGIAFALFHDPQILILDEPVNGLDPSGILEIRKLLRKLQVEQQKTIFISSHLLAEVEKVCTHIGIIQEGNLLFQGVMDDLLTQSGQRVRMKTDKPKEAIQICDHYALNAVLTERGLLELRLPNEREFSRILRLLISQDIAIYSVEQSRGTLEDLFIRLTKNE